MDQFPAGDTTVQFKPYSKFPPCYKDVTFWVPSGYHEHDFFALVREVAGDLVEDVTCIDEFAAKGRSSRCYRCVYRSMDRNLTNEEVDELQWEVRDKAVSVLGVELR